MATILWQTLRVLVWLVASIVVVTLQPARRQAEPIEPIRAMLDAFRTVDVVGSDVGHSGAPREIAFLVALVRDARFPDAAADLVVEGLSARYQSAMDRYLRGEDVPESALKPIWNETTQPQIPGPLWTGSVPPFFRAIRALNAELPAARRVRVLLGDPPIEWEHVHSREEFQRWLAQRDSFPAELVQREILATHRHALVLFGGGHLQRKQQATNYQMDSRVAQTVVSLLERAGTTTFLVHLIGDAAGAASWPAPSLAIIRGTDIGAAPVPQGSIPRVAIRDGRFEPIPRDQWMSMPQEEQFDAVLYLGSNAEGPAAISASVCADPALVKTRIERMILADIPPPVIDRVRTLCGGQP